MKAREHYAKSKFEPRKGIRRQKRNWGHPKENESKMRIIKTKKLVFPSCKEMGNGQKLKKKRKITKSDFAEAKGQS